MKIRFAAILLCLAIPAAAQTDSKSTSKRLPDDFARAAFKVLKMVEGETGSYSEGPDGAIQVPRATKESIDDVDADAESKDEQVVVTELQSAFQGKLLHNTMLGTLSVIASNYLMIHGQQNETSDIAALVAKVPKVDLMHRQEASCFGDLESKLRSRGTQAVTTCSTDAMKVPTVEIMDIRRVAEQN